MKNFSKYSALEQMENPIFLMKKNIFFFSFSYVTNCIFLAHISVHSFGDYLLFWCSPGEIQKSKMATIGQS